MKALREPQRLPDFLSSRHFFQKLVGEMDGLAQVCGRVLLYLLVILSIPSCWCLNSGGELRELSIVVLGDLMDEKENNTVTRYTTGTGWSKIECALAALRLKGFIQL